MRAEGKLVMTVLARSPGIFLANDLYSRGAHCDAKLSQFAPQHFTFSTRREYEYELDIRIG
jgi:hypothetical protein